jgi:exodeoxyribonuclease VII large subunit
VYEVSELCRQARAHLESRWGHVQVRGEVSDFRPNRGSGHWYFRLKDRQSVVSVAMFARENRQVRFPVEDGMLVVVTGRVTLYEAGGQFQVVAQGLTPAGEGELAAAYLALKARLEREGLFDPARKRPLPPHPRVVGVVTSLEGAALRDVLSVLRRRAPHVDVVISPAKVQGAEAPADLVAALRALDEWGRADVIIMGRGGGSLEDLWAFNDEALARAVRACRTPVVSAVGHETDTTISDWVADVRAPTPSAAAELVVPDRKEVLEGLRARLGRLHHAVHGAIQGARFRVDGMARRVPHPLLRLRDQGQRLDAAEGALRDGWAARIRAEEGRLGGLSGRLGNAHPASRVRAWREALDRSSSALRAAVLGRLAQERGAHLVRERRLVALSPASRTAAGARYLAEWLARARQAVGGRLSGAGGQVGRAAASLDALSPLGVLTRGYSLVTRARDGVVVRAPEDAPAGEALVVRVARGRVAARSEGAVNGQTEVSRGEEG